VLTHVSGVRSEVTAEWGPAGRAFRTRFEIDGTDGALHHDSAQEATSGRNSDPTVEMLAEFRAAIRGGPPPRVTPADAKAALCAALAAAEAALGSVP
jgi:predicted dehydrogenase